MGSEKKKPLLNRWQKRIMFSLNLALLIFMSFWIANLWNYNHDYFQDQSEIHCPIDLMTQEPFDPLCREMILAVQKINMFRYFALLTLIIRTLAWFSWIVPKDDPLKLWIKEKIKESGNGGET